jgi:hypothetical protein
MDRGEVVPIAIGLGRGDGVAENGAARSPADIAPGEAAVLLARHDAPLQALWAHLRRRRVRATKGKAAKDVYRPPPWACERPPTR